MKRLSPERQKIWQELQEIVKFCNPAPPFIRQNAMNIFLMPSRLWESTWVLSKMDKPGRVLDVACGNPAHMIWLPLMGFNYIGIDPKFEEGEKLAKFKHYLKSMVREPDILRNLQVLPLRMEQIEWENEFDYVISISAMEQIPINVVAQGIPLMLKALKPGGKMLLTVDQKLTHDGGRTYDGWYKEGQPHIELAKYFERIIISAVQAPEHDYPGPGLYHHLTEYLRRNPNRWAGDFLEFRNQPYGLEFIKKGQNPQYDIKQGYTDAVWYESPRPEICSWEQYQIERFSLEQLNQFYNIERVIEEEVQREGKFWSQSKVNEVVSSLDAGEKLDMIQAEWVGDRLNFVDGFHRAFVIERTFGLDCEIPVITRGLN